MASSRPERSSETSIGVITGTIVAHSAPRDPEAMTAGRAPMPGFGVRQTSRCVLFGTIGTIGTHKITQQGQHKIGKKEYSMTAQGPSWRPCNNRSEERRGGKECRSR